MARLAIPQTKLGREGWLGERCGRYEQNTSISLLSIARTNTNVFMYSSLLRMSRPSGLTLLFDVNVTEKSLQWLENWNLCAFYSGQLFIIQSMFLNWGQRLWHKLKDWSAVRDPISNLEAVHFTDTFYVNLILKVSLLNLAVACCYYYHRLCQCRTNVILWVGVWIAFKAISRVISCISSFFHVI